MGYLREHPHAMDNVQGVADWWMMREQVKDEVEILVRVLQRLADQKLIEKIDSIDGPLYRLSP
jgi:hypothetical protein